MKNLYILSLLLALFALNISCDDDGGTSSKNLSKGALTNLTLANGSPEFIINSTFANTELKFSVDLSFGDPESFDLKALYKTFGGEFYGPVTIDANVGSFPKDYVLTGSEVISAFTEINSVSDMNAGDNIFFYAAFTMKDGTVLETLNTKGEPNYYAADFNQIGDNNYFLAYPVTCAPQPGVYRIEMHDAYDDGWQTNDDNGGNGIQLILDGELTAEVGLCNPYVDSPYNCVGDYTDGIDTVTIPEGTAIAIWQFPGDQYGEISFEIYGPNDELLLASGPGEAVSGPLTVILCAE
ncbi:hypothetical protein HPE56_10305 [Maribacter sp. ANRC-HE7]|uniref:DUF4397 domain-containing protein n=1 Tax=Maribacter aquimaris TaxID=2737171 RepID=A0ABR7V3C3_9FLAO|nr:hypothetical protein [Maribacter aquimaris]MBD0778186.1 hypothetical protein [Maribacter aquimaris]